MIEVSVEAKRPKSGAVVERGVMEIPLPIDPDELNMAMGRVAWLVHGKESHLLGPPLPPTWPPVQAEVAEQSLGSSSPARA